MTEHCQLIVFDSFINLFINGNGKYLVHIQLISDTYGLQPAPIMAQVSAANLIAISRIVNTENKKF